MRKMQRESTPATRSSSGQFIGKYSTGEECQLMSFEGKTMKRGGEKKVENVRVKGKKGKENRKKGRKQIKWEVKG
jgi:hypothetical protein